MVGCSFRSQSQEWAKQVMSFSLGGFFRPVGLNLEEPLHLLATDMSMVAVSNARQRSSIILGNLST
jgi:hypothetical protein